MIVNRRTFVIKPGCMQEAINLFTTLRGTDTFRIYVPEVSRFDILSIEIECKDLAEYEKMWDEWFSKPESKQFNEKLYTVLANGSTNEIWELV